MKIAVLTATRAEYGILKPVLAAIAAHKDMKLCLLAGGTHYLKTFGETYKNIEADGFKIAEKLDFLVEGADTPADIAAALGRATQATATALKNQKPDALILLGDRYELMGAASAALMMNVPIVHLFGGETTQGAIDEQIRHAITKMAHIHCRPTDETAARIRQMGEEEKRIFVTGHPGLDALSSITPPSRAELETTLGGAFKDDVYLVTFHPETLRGENNDMDALLGALTDAAKNATIIVTHPNADAGYADIVKKLQVFAKTAPDARLFESLGQVRYYGVLKLARAIIGNSSSGLLEAPSFGCPAINIGDRQKGRIRAVSVIDVPADRKAIAAAIQSLKDKDFSKTKNPYYKAGAIQNVVNAIAAVGTMPGLLVKTFVDRP